jgi:hypothetical protein
MGKFGAIFVSLAATVIVATLPLLLIWVLRTLFGLEIEYDVETWFAAYVVIITLILSKLTSKTSNRCGK